MSALLVKYTGDINTLSKRQRECLTAYARGLIAKQIGEELGLSQKSVEYHLEAVRVKLGCNTVQAVVLAVKAGWV
jgi:LuxR family quorum-sensing system transcriptional regulator SolR